MAALSEDGSYGLDCGQRSAGNVSVLHVKLTETALKAVESHQRCRVSASGALSTRKQPPTTSLGGLTRRGSAGKPPAATHRWRLLSQPSCGVVAAAVVGASIPGCWLQAPRRRELGRPGFRKRHHPGDMLVTPGLRLGFPAQPCGARPPLPGRPASPSPPPPPPQRGRLVMIHSTSRAASHASGPE